MPTERRRQRDRSHHCTTRTCVPSLGIYPVGGGAYTPVPIPFVAGDGSFAWTPDGTKLSFYRRSGYACGGMNLNYTSDLYTLNAHGGGLTDIAPGLPRPNRSPGSPMARPW